MNQINIDLNIRAVGKLYQYCADRRHHLVNKTERGSDDVWKRAEEINDIIKQQYHIDAFNIEDESQYLHYEGKLSEYSQAFNHKYILRGRDIANEAFVMLRSKDYYIEDFKQKDFSEIKDFELYGELHIKASKFKTLIKNIINVNIYQETENDIENYFVTSKMTYKKIDRIVLIHAKGAERVGKSSWGRDTPNLALPRGSIFAHIVKKHPTKVALASVMIVKKSDYDDIAHLPARLFMLMLDRYGIDIKTGKVKKRFFKQLTENVELPFDKVYHTNTLFESYDDTNQKQTFKNFYALDLKRHGNDISKGRI